MLFSYTIFLSIRVFCHEYSRFTRQQRSVGSYFLNFSLQLPPASQSLGYKPSDYCRELTSAHSYQPNSNQEFSVSKRKSLNTRLNFPISQDVIHIQNCHKLFDKEVKSSHFLIYWLHRETAIGDVL